MPKFSFRPNRTFLVRMEMIKSFQRFKDLTDRTFLSEMEKSPGTRPKPKEDFRTEAMTNFAPISGGQFNGAWKKAIEESGAAPWARAGRTRKSNR